MAEENSENLTYQKELQKLQEENQRLHQEIERLSKDPLTNWLKEEPAKQAFLELIESDPKILDKPITVMRVDLNRLREINNQYSHQAGNQLITGFGEFMNRYIEGLKEKYPSYREHLQDWIPFRFFEHGDEFGFILIGIDQKQGVDIEDILPKQSPMVEVTQDAKVKISFRVGCASSDGVEEERDLRALKETFPENRQFAAEMLAYLKKTADLKERNKRRNV